MRPELIPTPAPRPGARPGVLAACVLIAAACLGTAAPALAQERVAAPSDGRANGMRYLTWPGKVDRSRPVPRAAPPLPVPRRDTPPSGAIMTFAPAPPTTTTVPTRYSARTGPGPTPATTWIADARAPAPAFAPGFVPAPPLNRAETAPPYAARPLVRPETAAAYAPPPAPPPRPPVESDTAPTYAPPPPARVAADTGPAPAPTPTPRTENLVVAPPSPSGRTDRFPVEAAPPVSVTASDFDPMAPRRDAPIFRLLNRNAAPAPVPEDAAAADAPPAPQRSAPEAAPPPPLADDRSPRRYSVHRANGQAPDRTPLPDPVFLDSAPVDLAEPPAAPTVVRNVDGRIRAVLPNEDPTLP